MKTLSINNDFIIQNSDKGNSIVLDMRESDYLDKMYNIVSDYKTIVKSSVVIQKDLNFIDGIRKKLFNSVEELNRSETTWESDYKKPKPRGSSFGVLYGLYKLIKSTLINVHHLHLFCQQLKLPLTI